KRFAMGRNKTITDQELLQHARAVFLKHGRAGSTKEIARRAGISEAVLFQRFRAKRDLAIAALHPVAIDAKEALQLDSLSQDFRKALTQIGKRMLALFHQVIPASMQLIMSFGMSPEEILVNHSVMEPLATLRETIGQFLAKARSRRQ